MGGIAIAEVPKIAAIVFAMGLKGIGRFEANGFGGNRKYRIN